MSDEKNKQPVIDTVIKKVMDEQSQGHSTRINLFVEIEKILNKPVIAFFTSFNQQVSIEDTDTDMLAGMLQMMDLSNGLVLMVSSPGGDGLAAERIINVCRTYSKTGEYVVIVPGKAKSAATMLCFGASQIMMGPTSELGPVDPQVMVRDNGLVRYVAVYHIVKSYEELFQSAVRETGKLEPYLQQLAKYDASIIKQHQAAIDLSRSITIQALKTGMMSDKNEDEIEKSVKIFLDPPDTKSHGRPIFSKHAKDSGLNIETIDHNTQ
jgi:ClpP class serine protease